MGRGVLHFVMVNVYFLCNIYLPVTLFTSYPQYGINNLCKYFSHREVYFETFFFLNLIVTLLLYLYHKSDAYFVL